MTENSTTNLQEKLETISALEKEHGILGISFTVADGKTADPEEAADYVIAFIREAVQASANRDEIPLLKGLPV